MQSPANSTCLLAALKRAKAGLIEPQNLDELYKKFGLNEEEMNTDIAAAS